MRLQHLTPASFTAERVFYYPNMSNIIDFPNADELLIEVDLEELSLADVLEALYEQTDAVEAVIIYRDSNGNVKPYTDLEGDDLTRLVDDF